MEEVTTIIVRYAETDKMGITHHSVYPIWYEVARTEYIKKIGMTYSQMEQEGAMTPLVELNCRYLAPSTYEDELVIKVGIQKLTPARIVFGYEVINKQTQKIINTGTTMHALVGKDLKPINLKKQNPKLYEKLLVEYEKNANSIK